MVVKPYQLGDSALVNTRARDDWGVAGQADGMAYTLWDGDTPIACGGVLPNYEGVGSVWCVVSDEARHHGLELTKKVKFLMNDTMEFYGMHRLNALVLSDKDEYVRWAKIMGFEVEAKLEQAAPDKTDLYLMGKVV